MLLQISLGKGFALLVGEGKLRYRRCRSEQYAGYSWQLRLAIAITAIVGNAEGEHRQQEDDDTPLSAAGAA
jgi:hypothetical protein